MHEVHFNLPDGLYFSSSGKRGVDNSESKFNSVPSVTAESLGYFHVSDLFHGGSNSLGSHNVSFATHDSQLFGKFLNSIGKKTFFT